MTLDECSRQYPVNVKRVREELLESYRATLFCNAQLISKGSQPYISAHESLDFLYNQSELHLLRDLPYGISLDPEGCNPQSWLRKHSMACEAMCGKGSFFPIFLTRINLEEMFPGDMESQKMLFDLVKGEIYARWLEIGS